jgi:hypothetical protein
MRNSDRYSTLFHDLRYVLSMRGVQNFLVAHPSYLKTCVGAALWDPHRAALGGSDTRGWGGWAGRYLDLLSLFQGMDEQRREMVVHVEYESNRWTRSFQLTIQLTRTIPLVGMCYSARERDPLGQGDLPNELQPASRLPAPGACVSLGAGVCPMAA